MPEATLLTVFLAGLLGGGHCAGIVGPLSAGATILAALSFVPVWLVSTFALASAVPIGLEL